MLTPDHNQPHMQTDAATPPPSRSWQATPAPATGRPWRARSGFPPALGIILLALLIGIIAFSLFNDRGALNGTAGPGLFSDSNVQALRERALANVRPSVVQINVRTQNGGSLGSGEIIDPRGYIVTNNHVIAGGQSFQVEMFNGTRLPAQLTGADPFDDLAVIKINPPARMTVIKVGDSSKLQVGQDVVAIGNPLGITQTATGGIVSALGRTIPEEGQGTGRGVILDAIQTDAAINPGNSGGALVDLDGNLVGIPTLVPIDPEFNTPASGVGFAIPANRVKFIAPQLITNGNVTHSGRGDLGVRVTDVDPAVAAQLQLAVNSGVLVVDVANNGPADQAGLRQGDVIVQVDNTQVRNVSTLSDIIISKDPGTTINLQIYRGTQQMSIKVKLGELQVS